MKKYIFLLIVCCCWSCGENEYMDITVMSEATTTGSGTFACLIDGWLYVGGRYNEFYGIMGSPSIQFDYDEQADRMDVRVRVKPEMNIAFVIQEPVEGKQSVYTGAYFGDDPLPDGKVMIIRLDKNERIISGRFEGGQVTEGRFDVKYWK